jgi:hypothetical protein
MATNLRLNHHKETKDNFTLNKEPYLNRWQRRFTATNATHPHYFLFKHILKAGRTSLCSYFADVFAYRNISCKDDDYRRMKKNLKRMPPKVLYVEHEFQTLIRNVLFMTRDCKNPCVLLLDSERNEISLQLLLDGFKALVISTNIPTFQASN